MSNVALTSLVKAGGCGSKIGADDLRKVLAGLHTVQNPNVLFGWGIGDDAGVYQLTPELAIVQTVDFFTPIVDNPYDFGAIAAANALSDCFVLGAQPVTGLNIVAFNCAIGTEILQAILRGGSDKMQEAGAVIIGGHSVSDPEPKYGVAVTGVVHPARMIPNDAAKPGDALVLTKKIGTGIVTNLYKTKSDGAAGARKVSEAVYKEAVESMKFLNRKAAETMARVGVHASTDVTGFGLLGHARNLAEASGVAVEISFSAVPKFEGTAELAASSGGGGAERNRKAVQSKIVAGSGIGDPEILLLADAQTSGPLLIAVEEAKCNELLRELKSAGLPVAERIGTVQDGPAGELRIVR